MLDLLSNVLGVLRALLHLIKKKIYGEGAVKRHIMDMGITKGVEIKVRKTAPLGDPIEITLRGYELTLRKADAEMIEIE